MDIYNKLGKYLQREIDTYLLPKLQYNRVMRDIKFFREIVGEKQHFFYYQITKVTGAIRTINYRIKNYHFFNCDDFDESV